MAPAQKSAPRSRAAHTHHASRAPTQPLREPRIAKHARLATLRTPPEPHSYPAGFFRAATPSKGQPKLSHRPFFRGLEACYTLVSSLKDSCDIPARDSSRGPLRDLNASSVATAKRSQLISLQGRSFRNCSMCLASWAASLIEPLLPVVADEEREAVSRPCLVRALEVVVDRPERPALAPVAEAQRDQVIRRPWRVADLRHPVVGATAQRAVLDVDADPVHVDLLGRELDQAADSRVRVPARVADPKPLAACSHGAEV